MITVLVVDDEPLVVSLIQRAASQYGYAAVGTDNPAEALDILADPNRPVDVLLTDIVMPGINGRELANRAAGLRSGLPVVYMSGYSELENQAIAEAANTCGLLHKPFSVSALLESLGAATRSIETPAQ